MCYICGIFFITFLGNFITFVRIFTVAGNFSTHVGAINLENLITLVGPTSLPVPSLLLVIVFVIGGSL